MKRLLLLCGALRASATKGKDEPPLVARQVDGAISEGTYFRRGYHSCESKFGVPTSSIEHIVLIGVRHSRRPEWKGLH